MFFCTVCPNVNCLLFFLHCLSICKLFVVFLHCLSICKLLLLFFCTVCPYVNCLLFFCTVCPYVNCLLFLLHCLSICKLLLLFFCTVCPYVNCCLLFFCTVWSTLIRISLTKALVLWWCDNKSDLIWFDLIWFDEEQQIGKAVQFSQTKMLTLLSWGLKRRSVCVSLIYRTKVTLTARTDWLSSPGIGLHSLMALSQSATCTKSPLVPCKTQG